MNLDLLTPRERVVVASLREGTALKVLALDLEIDPSTVSMHAASAARKLGLAGRLAIVSGSNEPDPAAFAALASALAPGEREVAWLAVLGLTNAEIGARRGTSARTVANQLARVYRKLGVGSRARLAALAHRTRSIRGASAPAVEKPTAEPSR